MRFKKGREGKIYLSYGKKVIKGVMYINAYRER